MKHALHWIIENFYSERIDEIWDNPDVWEEIFDKHVDAYLASPDFKARKV